MLEALLWLLVNSDTGKTLDVLINEMKAALTSYIVKVSDNVLSSYTDITKQYKMNIGGTIRIKITATSTNQRYLNVYNNGTRIDRITLPTGAGTATYTTDAVIVKDDVITFDLSGTGVTINSINFCGDAILEAQNNLIIQETIA